MLKIKDKEDILKATRREKKDSKRNKESQADLSTEAMQASRQRRGTSEVLKDGRQEAQEDAQSLSEQTR